MRSWLVDTGVDSVRTAMAKTVGLPLGIAAMQFLTGKWKAAGLQIPTLPEIYVSVLEELKNQGIAFEESIDQ
jgi:saccharopine dehydrogenase-like NADP-dependent oxidoreductase